jgi:hypothetical protein
MFSREKLELERQKFLRATKMFLRATKISARDKNICEPKLFSRDKNV